MSAIAKALYRPASFFRGFIFPFLETKQPILRQAEIIASVLARRSFPNTHGAAAIFQCCATGYSAIQNLILKALVDKKFSLPQVIIDRLTHWFLSFQDLGQATAMPLLWFQTLASFVKHYGRELSSLLGRRSETETASPG
jgi:essential nuclear protein 1